MTDLSDAAQTLVVYVPVGKEPAARAPARAPHDRASGAAFVIGLLDNHKYHSDVVLDRLQERLSDALPGVRFVRARKPEACKGAPKAVLDDLAARCHAVVTGIAD